MMEIREHKTLIFQHRNEKLFSRMRYFDELDGQIVYRSGKFDFSFLARKIEGKTLIIDFSSLEIKYRKRANQSISEPTSSSQDNGDNNDNYDATYDYTLYHWFIQCLKSSAIWTMQIILYLYLFFIQDYWAQHCTSSTSWRRQMFKADYCHNNEIWPNVKIFLVIGSKIVQGKGHVYTLLPKKQWKSPSRLVCHSIIAHECFYHGWFVI